MSAGDAPTVVDLGCGDGISAQIFRKFEPDVRWIGVDIERSETARALQDEEVIIYDGTPPVQRQLGPAHLFESGF